MTLKTLAQILADTETNIRARLRTNRPGAVPVYREELMDALLDQHGTGRVMFRNTRATISGFPKRVARLCPLAAPASDDTAIFDTLVERNLPPIQM